MFTNGIVNPTITPLYQWEIRAYKFPAHFMWTTIRFTVKHSVDCHYKGHIVLSCKTPYIYIYIYTYIIMLTFVFQVSVPIFVLLKCIIVLFESFAKL